MKIVPVKEKEIEITKANKIRMKRCVMIKEYQQKNKQKKKINKKKYNL